jgi:hypothetical protein
MSFRSAAVAVAVVCLLALAADRFLFRSEPAFGAGPPLTGSTSGVDTVAGDLKSTIGSQAEAGTSALVKTGYSYFVCANGFNEGTVTGWVQFFNQASLDAGGTGGLTPPMVPVRVPAGAGFSICEPQAFSQGIDWYASSTQGTLTTAGAPVFSVDVTYR